MEARRHIVELVRRASEDRPDVDFERDLRSHLTDDPDWTRHGHFSVSSMSLRGLVALAQVDDPRHTPAARHIWKSPNRQLLEPQSIAEHGQKHVQGGLAMAR